MFKLDPQQCSTGPICATGNYYPPLHPHPQGKWYLTLGDTIEYLVQYETDAAAIEALLPEPYTPGNPTVTILHTWLSNSDVVEGGSYALSCVIVGAKYKGQDGHYILIMPENNNYTTHMGRDTSGTPKIFAHIPYPFTHEDGRVRVDTRVWGYDGGKEQWQTFYGVEFAPMKKCDAAGMKKWNDIMNGVLLYALKVIPGADGGLDLVYPYQYGFIREFKECWEGTDATIILGEGLDKSLTIENKCVEVFKKLPVKKVLATAAWRSWNGGNPELCHKIDM